MKNVTNKLRVVHFPQVGSKAGFFEVAVKDEEQASFTINLLANQHLWLFANKVIPDYANIITVEMYDENIAPNVWCMCRAKRKTFKIRLKLSGMAHTPC
jgi:hypothetical protein